MWTTTEGAKALMAQRLEAAPRIFRVFVGQGFRVGRHVEFRLDAQDLAALNAG